MAVEQLITQHIDTWTSVLKTRSTAGRGSNGKIDLYGIKKLRELILELAVRGKLVPQDPNDEPASELLKRIAQQRDELVKTKQIKKTKKLAPLDAIDTPFELPSGWEWCYLNDIGDWGAGATPNRSNSNYYGGEIPWFKSGELSADFIFDSEEYITDMAMDECSLRDNKPGDVLIAMYGATIGKASILNVRGTTNQAVCACTPFVGISNIYLLTLLKAYKRIFTSMGAGGAQPNISREKIIATIFALPSENEQERIVDKVNELMSLCDQLEQQSLTSLDAHSQLVETLLATLTDSQNAEELAENWARISQHFDTLFTTEASIEALKQTILQLAVMGLLIESAEFSQRSHLKKYLSFGPRNGLSPSEVKYETDVKVLKLGATSYGYLKLQETKYVDIDTSYKLHLFLRKGDILIQRGNSSNFVGCSLLIEKNFDNLIYPDLMMKIRTKDELLPEYAALWLSSPFARNYMWSKMTGTSGTMPKISKKVVEDVPIAVPPLAVQHQLVVKIKELSLLCGSLKSRLQSAQQTQLHLADALTDAALS